MRYCISFMAAHCMHAGVWCDIYIYARLLLHFYRGVVVKLRACTPFAKKDYNPTSFNLSSLTARVTEEAIINIIWFDHSESLRSIRLIFFIQRWHKPDDFGLVNRGINYECFEKLIVK